MFCVETIPPKRVDSEREEGEIVDELDDLSDISSEEEFLLRQRLQVLENYNNVLERKEAKRSYTGSGNSKRILIPHDLSHTSSIKYEESVSHTNSHKIDKQPKTTHRKNKKRKDNLPECKDLKKKQHKQRKKVELTIISESSEESDYEYRNKRRKLANAVLVKTGKTDTSLKSRLLNMICSSNKNNEPVVPENHLTATEQNSQILNVIQHQDKNNDVSETITIVDETIQNTEVIDLCVEEETKDTSFKLENTENAQDIGDTDKAQDIIDTEHAQDAVDGLVEHTQNDKESALAEGSDEDLEMLRQHALKSKLKSTKHVIQVTPARTDPKDQLPSEAEDEDSDTAELRLICLRSALLKKAIEMKQKQKLRKRLSQSTSLYDDIIAADHEIASNKESDNNTDTESVDMDIVSDGPDEDKEKNFVGNSNEKVDASKKMDLKLKEKQNINQNDELDEDEDLLRAKLLTSLSKSLPLLVDANELNESIDDVKSNQKANLAAKLEDNNAPVERRFIINTANSDSEGEHEATKNLTKMHMKLSTVPLDFEEKLDLFLKSTRLEVEREKIPDIVQDSPVLPAQKTPEKFVPKVVNHLPKSEQIEYKNLVKRMAELEKIKQVRQGAINIANKTNHGDFKETLKPRNVTIEKPTLTNKIDEQIAQSRKRIAEESARVLKLKEEAMNLSQKYKIVATELRNLATAISLNKKEQRLSQMTLAKIRSQHQLLVKRSSHSTTHINNFNKRNTKSLPAKIQKENEPIKAEYKNAVALKSVKVSVVNDYKEESRGEQLSVQIDVGNNKKTVVAANTVAKHEMNKNKSHSNSSVVTNERMEEENGRTSTRNGLRKDDNGKLDDYQSPLSALNTINWEEDPNGVLCPFEVGGSCKDVNCKYLHPKSNPGH